MRKSDSPDKARRAALLRLGLGALAVYTAPAFSSLSRAHASGGSGGGGNGGGSRGGSGGGGSGGSGGGSRGGSGGGSSGASSGSAANSTGQSSGASTSPDRATISARDHRRAREAVKEGRALPLIDVLKQVRGSFGGDLISVRYRETRTVNSYIFKVVTDDGRLVEVSVDALTAQIIGGSG